MCHHCGAHATPPKFSELVMFWWFMVLSNIWKRKYIIRARGAHPFHNNWHASCHNTDPSRHNTHASRHNSHPCSPMNDFHMTAYRTRVSPRRLPCHNLVQYVHHKKGSVTTTIRILSNRINAIFDASHDGLRTTQTKNAPPWPLSRTPKAC